MSSLSSERPSLSEGVTWRERVLRVGFGVTASVARSTLCVTVRRTADVFASIVVLPRYCLSFTVVLADTESLCLKVSSQEEVEEVSSVPASRLFWVVAVSSPACGPYCSASSRRVERGAHSFPGRHII